MPTEVREHEGKGHTFRVGVLLYLACIAVCAIFFSLGFLVGFNERGSHSGPTTEVVTPPSVVPPTINPPPDTGQLSPPDPSQTHSDANTEPQTEVIPAGGGPVSSAPPDEPAKSTPSKKHTKAEAKAEAAPAAAPGEVGEGIMLQVAALRTRQDAETMVSLLKARGYPVFMVPPINAHAEDSLYRVQVGPFRTKSDADHARDKLVGEGFKPFVKH